MLDNSTNELNTSQPLETRIIEIGQVPDARLFNGLATRRERLATLERSFADRKKLITERLLEMEGVTVRNLSSANTLLVTAPEDVWPVLTAMDGPLAQPDVRIHPNQSIAARFSAGAS